MVLNRHARGRGSVRWIMTENRLLDGTVEQQYNSLAFQGPLAAGAVVDPSNQQFLNTMWNYLSTKTGSYYDESLQLLSMIVASGNWFQP